MATLKSRVRIEADGSRVPILAPPPTLSQMAANLTRHTAQIARSGFQLADSGVVNTRLAICAGCEFWEATARLGMGKCNHPACGCTKAKHLFAVSRCPLGLW